MTFMYAYCMFGEKFMFSESCLGAVFEGNKT